MFYTCAADRQSRPPSPRKAARNELNIKVRTVFHDSDDVYGVVRVTAQLAREGTIVDKKTVARQSLENISPKRFTPVTTIPGVDAYKIPDLARRGWDNSWINAVWISDITYLRTGEGWLYLAAITDAHSRRILSWTMDSPMGNVLVERVLRMAQTFVVRCPRIWCSMLTGGGEFTSNDMFTACRKLQVRQSMGRTGVCWDNAMAKSVWATLKTNFYDRCRWSTKLEARHAVANWIETRYNRQRLHSALGYVPPVEFEMNLVHKPAAEEPKAAQLPVHDLRVSPLHDGGDELLAQL